MEGSVVTCPLAPDVPHLISGSCSPDQVRGRLARAFGLGFLQTPPRDGALALLLAFGSAKTWRGDFHPTSSVPCPAHTLKVTGVVERSGTTSSEAQSYEFYFISGLISVISILQRYFSINGNARF